MYFILFYSIAYFMFITAPPFFLLHILFIYFGHRFSILTRLMFQVLQRHATIQLVGGLDLTLLLMLLKVANCIFL
jgi:hypothetical protein